jgi:membrane protease YdiL (CAAX protease family)
LGGVISLPREAVISQLLLIPVYFIIVLFIGGPLGEEIGWRGYLLPRLMKQNNGLVSSIIVFIFWLVWHLPLFWLPGASQYGSPIGPYVIYIAAWSILFTWVYMGTSGSLLSALLLHTSINTFSLFLSSVDPANVDNSLIVYGGVLFSLLALFVVVMNRQMTRVPALKGV